MAGTLVISTLSDGTNSTSSTNCIQGSAKAWVNFNGVPATPSIRAAYNVSSITKSSTGNFTVTFTNALADANYATSMAISANTTANCMGYTNSVNRTDTANTSGLCYIAIKGTNDSSYDNAYVNVSCFR